MVEFNAKQTTFIVDLDRLIESAVFEANIVEHPQGRPGEVAKLWVVALGLKLSDDDDWDDDFVLSKSADCRRVCEENAGI